MECDGFGEFTGVFLCLIALQMYAEQPRSRALSGLLYTTDAADEG